VSDFSFETSELETLAYDIGLIPEKLTGKVKPIVAKTALEVKKRMQRDLRDSKHFKQVASAVDYELKVQEFGGDASIEAEIGTSRSRSPSASLAGIAYFGTSKPGGATVRDPYLALLDEKPAFIGFLTMAQEGLL
jgi:hypothetical protein